MASAASAESATTFPGEEKSRGIIPGLVVGFAIFAGHAGTAASPYAVRLYVTALHYSVSQAGFMSMIELGAMALSTTIISFFIPQLSTRRLAVFASLLLAAANFLSIRLAFSFAMLAAIRVLAGASYGLVYASACAAGTRTRSAASALAVSQIAVAGLYAMHYVFCERAIGTAGLEGFYSYLGILGIFGVAVLMVMPDWSRDERKHRLSHVVPHLEKPRGGWVDPILGMAALSLTLAIWVFAERVGDAAGLSLTAMSRIQSVAGLIALSGGFAASLLGKKLGLVWPILIGLVLVGLAAALFTISSGALSYCAWLTLYCAAWYFAYAYVMTKAVAVDPSGRVASLVGSTYLIGYAIGAGSAGALAGFTGYRGVGVAALTVTLAATAMIGVNYFRDRQRLNISAPVPPSS